jgi:RNA polymerase sigma factor (TIGR02999 family)
MVQRSESPTELLLAWGRGDTAARDRLIPLVHDELRQLAGHYMRRERPEYTLQATALVNEVYLRLVEVNQIRWQNRAHFFAMSARLMRRILIDAARAQRSEKRGGNAVPVPLEKALTVSADRTDYLLALDGALHALESVHPRKARVVELRYFGGLTAEEAAESLGISTDAVKRDWRFAKLWLLKQLTR